MRRLGLPLLLLVIMLLLSSCSGIAYYSQLLGGQFTLWQQRQPIEQLMVDNSLDPQLKRQLQKIMALRQFAVARLGLPDSASFHYYNDLNRSHVLWNVFAAEEFSVEPKRWCFPIAGCVAYRGYFSRRAAIDYAQQLRGQGYDTFVGGVSAYSTLGWFADPVLSSFVYRDEAELAALIFHELAHQQLYQLGDTAFNESFATAVAIAGVTRWYQSRADGLSELTVDHRSGSKVAEDMRRNRDLQRAFVELLMVARADLAALYQQDLSAPLMRSQKQLILTQLREVNFRDFKQRWPGGEKYQHWFDPRSDDHEVLSGQGSKAKSSGNSAGNRHQRQNRAIKSAYSNGAINNARLNTVASYNQWLPAFQVLLRDCEQNLPCFYQRATELAALDVAPRLQRLRVLSRADGR